MQQAGRQLPLALRLADEYSFDSFAAGSNEALLQTLCDARPDAQRLLYLWGEPGCGRTHLLQAACRQQGERGGRCMYLPLREWLHEGPELLLGLEDLDLVCIDDLQLVKGEPCWQEALFHFYNRMLGGTARLLFAADAPPTALGLDLRDFVTRLSQCLVLQVQALVGDAALDAFAQRARMRGMLVRDDVFEYLGNRHRRDLPALMATLDRIDAETLRQQRRLTIPLLRELMGW